MSYCALIPLINGEAAGCGTEFSNSWGGSARIWNSLFESHCPKKHEYDSWLSCAGDSDRRLWDLAKDKRLNDFARIVHAFTFDNFYVSKANFKRMALDLRKFVEVYPTKGTDHLPAWANLIETAESCDGIGIHATSVNENPWCFYTRVDDDVVKQPVILEDCVEVYAWMNKL